MQKIVYGFLAGVFICGGFWFYMGRVNTESIQAIAKQVSESNNKSQQISDSIRKRYDQITSTVAELDIRSARIKAISLTVTTRSQGLANSSGRIESGINNVKESVDRIENRNRKIVSIVNELQKTNESFYERVKGNAE